VLVTIDGQGYAFALDNLAEQHKVTLGILLLSKQGIGNDASGIIYGPYQG
jgi:hypothetical protein